MRHPPCVSTILRSLCINTYSRTQLHFPLVLQEDYNDMFWPYMWLWLDYRTSYTGMCGAFLGSSGGGCRDLIITVGTMVPGFIRWITISSFIVSEKNPTPTQCKHTSLWKTIQTCWCEHHTSHKKLIWNDTKVTTGLLCFSTLARQLLGIPYICNHVYTYIIILA